MAPTEKRAPAKTAAVTKKPAEKKPAEKKPAEKKPAKPKLLAGGNPQIAKGYGNESVHAYLDAMPGWKQVVGRRLDTLITDAIPTVAKAVKWNTPFYGFADQGWFVAFHCYDKYVKVTFFRGASLDPLPPGKSKSAEVRYLDVREDDLDEPQFVAWVRQASELPLEKL